MADGAPRRTFPKKPSAFDLDEVRQNVKMADGAPRRTFPKKPSAFDLVEVRQKVKVEDEPPRRTFPKKPNSFAVSEVRRKKRSVAVSEAQQLKRMKYEALRDPFTKNLRSVTVIGVRRKRKNGEASYGGKVLHRRPKRYFEADFSEESGPSDNKPGRNEVPNGKKNSYKIETTEHFGPTAIPDFIPLPKSHKSSSKPCKRPGVVVTKIKKGVKAGSTGENAAIRRIAARRKQKTKKMKPMKKPALEILPVVDFLAPIKNVTESDDDLDTSIGRNGVQIGCAGENGASHAEVASSKKGKGKKKAKKMKMNNEDMKEQKKVRPKKKGKKAERGKSVKGTCIEHKMLGGSDDEMYASEDDVMDVSDMIKGEPKGEEEEEEEEQKQESVKVPIVNSSVRAKKVCGEVRTGSSELNCHSKTVRRVVKFEEVKQEVTDTAADEGAEKVVEFRTGRGSSRLVFSSDSDDDDEVKREPGNEAKRSRTDFAEMADESESDFEHEFHERDKKASHRGMDKPATSMEMAEDEEEEDGEEEDGDERAEEVAAFRAEMADLPLGKVREMKEKLGLKLFNKAYFGTKADDKDKERQKRQAVEEKKQEHRGQHRPKEISSKRPVSTFRPLYQNLSTGKKRWDPRFDIRAGEFKERCFEDNYSFLDDLRRQEREELSKQAADCDENGDTEMAARIREAIRRMDNREKTKAEKKLKQETYKELRQENIDRMMRGERPVFKTKAKVRLMHMEKKFDQLKKDNKLENYMKRRAKKEAHREVKKKPSFEHQYGYQ